jgi:site-specific recombinase XerD
MMTTDPASHTEETDLRYLRRSFVRHLAADGRSAATRAAYGAAIDQLEAFLADHGLPTTVRQLQPDHVEAFMISLYERQLRPATILARHHALARFFGWLVDESELASSPMTQLPRPAAPPPHLTILSPAEVEALVAICAGSEFEDLRDDALIRLFVDTGVRLTEMAGLQLDDVDLERDAVYLAGTGRGPRAVPFDRSTTRAVQRYLAARADHDRAHMSALWLGRRGRLTQRGVDQAIRHRGQLARLPNLRPHQVRHTFVKRYLAEGGNGRDLMRLVGWKSRQLLGRYRGETPAERPRAEWLRLGDRL